MKTVVNRASLFLRLGIAATAILLGQQALALGTDAGTTVANQATVAYSVNSEAQTPIESDPAGNSTPGAGSPTEFLVDRRVAFTLVEIGGLHTEVAPGDVQAFTEFQLTNNGNAIMDFVLNAVDLAITETVHGEDDTGDSVGPFTIRVANGDGIAGVPDYAADLDFVDELGEEETVVIYVYADIPGTAPNDAYDNFTLNATAADDPDALPTVGGTPDPLLTESGGADDPLVIESVFANTSGADGSGNATEGADDGFHVNSAELVITKTAAVISAPFGSTKALPDAVIEYTVTIDNSAGAAIAQNVVLTDTIQIADVTLEDEAYGVNQDVTIDGAFCNADLGDTTPAPDGCAYDAGTGALSIAVPDIAIGATTTITYQVRISPL
jgi:hypothetical protein